MWAIERLPLVGDVEFWAGEFSTGTRGKFRPELTRRVVLADHHSM